MTAEAKRTNSKSSCCDFRAGLVVALPLLLFQALGGFQIDATESVKLFFGQNLLDGCLVFLGEVGVLVELGFEPLHFLEMVDEGAAGIVALEVGHCFRFAGQALGLHEVVQLLDGSFAASR